MPLAFCLKPITFVPQQTEKRYQFIPGKQESYATTTKSLPGFEARFSQNLAPVSREKPQNPYLAYISH
ncbi:MAG: hypothetical protein EWV68_13850 [Microcystis sp. M_QC_C_20170808_M9Col]|nr:MAG: hypothetical protein EWV68_13850 [Microcystis sp. M_QC_C_20170808_M9Col]